MTYKNQIVRDLAWAVVSPPLMVNSKDYPTISFLDIDFFKSEYEEFKHRLLLLDENPADLKTFLAGKDITLLGKYFERLIEFWLINSENKELLLSNYQIIENGDTLGEFDFVYIDKITGEVIHLEAAGKFYLGFLSMPTWSNFIGPNNNDRLSLKMDKFLTSQFTLGRYYPELKSLLGISDEKEIVHKIFFKGYFFYHLKQCLAENFVFPENAFNGHLKGWWFSFKERHEFLTDKSSRWIIPDKHAWMPPFEFVDEKDTLNTDELNNKLKKHFDEKNSAVLLIHTQAVVDGYKEKSRGFVVPDNWPFG